MLNDGLEGCLVNRRQLTQAAAKLAELIVNVDVSAFAVLDPFGEREGEDGFRQLSQICCQRDQMPTYIASGCQRRCGHQWCCRIGKRPHLEVRSSDATDNPPTSMAWTISCKLACLPLIRYKPSASRPLCSIVAMHFSKIIGGRPWSPPSPRA